MYTPVSGSGANGNLLSVDTCLGSGGVTPRTPEILNSLIAMTNPLDCSLQERQQREAATTPASSVQQTCSQLIKAGLKLSIQSKRKHSSSESCSGSKFEYNGTTGSEDDEDERMSPTQGLTPEDEERRRRRRERNKIAATKCRQKKRERTVNLVTESNVLETQNIDLKTQIKELDAQVRQLAEMLSSHKASCQRKHQGNAIDYQAAYNGFCSSANQLYLQSASNETVFGTESMNGFPDADVLRGSVLKHSDVYMSSTKDPDNLHILPDINTFAQSADMSIPKIEDTSFELSGEEEAKYTDLDNPDSFEFTTQRQHCHQDARGVLPT